MILRAAAVWLSLLVIAVAVGSARVGLPEPQVGERTAHQLDTLAVVALFPAATWLTVPWIEPGLERGRLIALGIGWAAATVLFERFRPLGRWPSLVSPARGLRPTRRADLGAGAADAAGRAGGHGCCQAAGER